MQEIFAIAARAGVDIARKPDALLGCEGRLQLRDQARGGHGAVRDVR